ncbi:MAG: site-specific integrase [Thaumarchaeota archaeon]|nr:site-specific integrase [Nitrososphaerota archaeon]
MAKSRHKHLLNQPDIQRWFNNVARGSVITAEERLRRLGRFCDLVGKTPQDLIEMKRADPEGFEKFILDFVDQSFVRGDKPTQVKNNLVTVKSWLGHYGLKIESKIKLPVADYVDEIVPSKEELASILRHCDNRSRVTASLMGFSGLRPESIGNYLGNDGIRLKDVPELRIEGGKIVIEKTPLLITVRKTLSKARHQYFTFLPEEGCQYLKEYLEARIREGEELNSESPLVGHLRPNKLNFLRTTKLTSYVKRAITKAGYSWRPYVLRSYCATAFDIGESKGLLSHPWRQFFMGHKGDIEARYSTNKGRLPPDMIEEMRASYKRCEQLLQTTKSEPIDDKIKHAFKEQLLMIAGFKKEEIEQMNLDSMADEEVQQKVRERLLGALTNNGNRQKVVPVAQVKDFIGQGWEYVAQLPDGEAIVKLPT